MSRRPGARIRLRGCWLRPWAGLVLALHVAVAAAATLPLALDPRTRHDAEVSVTAPGVWEIRTLGPDPYVATLPFAPAPVEASVLTFEYLCAGNVKPFEVFVGAPWSESRAQTAEALPYSEGWTEFSLNLQAARERGTGPLRQLRLDFGNAPGVVVQVRNLRLRAADPREQELDARRVARLEADRRLDAELRAYLARENTARLTRIRVGPDTIAVEGVTAGTDGDWWLAESPPWEELVPAGRPRRVVRLAPDPSGNFAVTVPRLDGAAEGMRDRLLTRWLVVRAGGERDGIMSAARYADEVTARHDLPPVVPATKKGLGGFMVGRADLGGDPEALGIGSVTVNLFLGRFLRGAASARTSPFTYQGRTYHVDRVEVEKLDRTLAAAAARGALVLGILLVPKAGAWDTPELGRIMQHPDCLPAGVYSMANVTSEAGVTHYAAIVDYLAERYSRPGQPHGRIHHWIVHNEVDAGWTWTNCGEKPPVVFLDQYHKSMRIVHLIARQYDPRARTYVSLTHFWTWTANFRYIPGRDVLRHLLAFSRAEGDFEWGLAHHPYPESLREPKTWLDRKATFAFDTPLITFRNLEVLDAWVKVPAHRFLGRTVRSVHLTEQGPNSPDYSPRALTEQAASLAYVWRKVRALDAIEGFQYHNWIDNRQEGGLRIGLRRFPDDAEEPLGRKPVWEVYRALDTPDEERATAFALPIIGIRQWDEVLHRGPIAGKP